MQVDNVEVVRRILAANRSGPPESTTEVAVGLCDSRVEFTSRVMAVGGGRYAGHDGIRRYFADMAEAWRNWENQPDEIVEIRENVVLAYVDFRGIGAQSAAPVETRNAVAFVLSAGKVVRVHSAPSRDEAFEALELSR